MPHGLRQCGNCPLLFHPFTLSVSPFPNLPKKAQGKQELFALCHMAQIPLPEIFLLLYYNVPSLFLSSALLGKFHLYYYHYYNNKLLLFQKFIELFIFTDVLVGILDIVIMHCYTKAKVSGDSESKPRFDGFFPFLLLDFSLSK